MGVDWPPYKLTDSPRTQSLRACQAASAFDFPSRTLPSLALLCVGRRVWFGWQHTLTLGVGDGLKGAVPIWRAVVGAQQREPVLAHFPSHHYLPTDRKFNERFVATGVCTVHV